MIAPDLVVFAIRAGVRLGQEARRAYVDRTKQRGLVLPLPSVQFTPDVFSARDFLADPRNAGYLEEFPRLRTLDATAAAGTIGPAGEAEFLTAYRQILAIDIARRKGRVVVFDGDTPALDVDAFTALVRLRQWEDDDPGRPRTERRIVGTIIDLGVAYFANVPGALDRDTRGGRAVAAFVAALDRIDFAAVATDDAPFAAFVGRLFVASLETLGEQPELLTNDRNVQELVGIAAAGLSRDVAQRVADERLGLVARARLEDWAEIVFRGLLTTAGRRLVAEPARFLGVDDEPNGALITSVGSALIDVAVADGGLELKRVFGRDGLNTVLDAALDAVARHPELVTGSSNSGVRGLVSAIALDLRDQADLLAPDVLPEVMRLVLEKSGGQLELIFPDLDPGRHLLLGAARTTLAILAAPVPPGATWTLRFTRDDVLAVLDHALDELAANPAWLLAAAADAGADLEVALEAALDVLRIHADARLSPGVAAAVLAAAVTAVALRQEFLDDLGDARPVVARVIEIVVAALFDDALPDRAQWQLLRDESITAIVGIALERSAGTDLDEAALAALDAALAGVIADVAEGAALDLTALDTHLREALAA